MAGGRPVSYIMIIYKHARGVYLRTTKNNTSWWSEQDLNLRSPDFKS